MKKMGELFIKVKEEDSDKVIEVSVMKFDSNYVWDQTVLDTINHYLKNDRIVEVKLIK